MMSADDLAPAGRASESSVDKYCVVWDTNGFTNMD